MLTLLLKAMFLGVCVAAPVGPISVLNINRTLQKGVLIGYVSSFGIATADMVYAAMAAFSLTVALSLLVALKFWFGLFGGIALAYLGYKVLKNPLPETSVNLSNRKKPLAIFTSIFFLTLSNPMTVLTFLALFASITENIIEENVATSFIMTVGVFLGALSWHLILCTVVGTVKHKMSPSVMQYVNYCSGIFLLGFGIYQLALLFLEYQQ